jgi:transposase
MEVLRERCAALDISKRDVKACVRAPDPHRTGKRRQEVRTFASMTNALLELKDWLTSERVSVVTMEATGDYWKPAYYLLEDGGFELMLVNARDAKGLPGRKTDVSDSAWLCQLTECGLLRPSLVPPEPIRRLRDLTRYRTTTVRERNREAQRLEKVLEDACVKLSAVATDILGVSGRAMLQALIDGERDPQVLADLAKQKLRLKHDALVEALTGRFNDHHAFLCAIILRRIDELSAVIDEVTARIDTELTPFADSVGHLVTVPGIDRKGAAVIIAETGGDMTRFRTAAHLASWAGVCPGSHESGGIKKPGGRRNGNKALGAALGNAAMGAARTKNTYLRERYYRLAARRGKQRAIVAIEHSLLTAIWHMLVNNLDYHELGPDHFTRREPAHVMRRITKQANALGLTVRFDPIHQTSAAT